MGGSDNIRIIKLIDYRQKDLFISSFLFESIIETNKIVNQILKLHSI